MRKNSVRKWLHAVLDFLPLLVIPIFAIYTRNENYNSNIEVEVQKEVVVDFNQQFNTTDIETTFDSNRCHTILEDGLINFSVASTNSQVNVDLINWNQDYYMHFVEGHKYYPKLIMIIDTIQGGAVNNGNLFLYPSYMTFNQISTTNSTYSGLHLFKNSNLQDGLNLQFYFNLFDLTQMFGSGNEPTKAQFDAWYDANYYPYVESETQILNNGTITYNDTDIGSQFVYTLYNATDKYFNCTNLFNLEQVWNWVQLNLFGGNAPLMVYVVWQVIVYEFFMDLIFLLYSVFMFVIDFATNCIDRFTGRANKC